MDEKADDAYVHDWKYRVSMRDQDWAPAGGYGVWVTRLSLSAQRQQRLTDEGWVDFEPGSYAPPTVSVPTAEAGKLLGSLWSEGLRPDKWGAEGENQALREHLDDMRVMAKKAVDHIMVDHRKMADK